MKVTCSTQDGSRVMEIEVGKSATFGDVKSILAVDFKVNPQNIILRFKNSNSVPDSSTLGSVGVEDNDMILVSFTQPSPSSPAASTSGNLSGLRTLDGLLPPNLRGLDITRLFEQAARARPNQGESGNFSKVRENFEVAMRENPESFAQVYMLYIHIEINGVPIKAFVDSGAQTTIMSRKCAERCGIMDMVDPRFAGVAMGVGSAKILGRVHLLPMKVGRSFYNVALSVMDQVQNVDVLIGLDLLKRYQCTIDLRKDVLHIGSNNEVVPFLKESELPAHAKLNL